MSKRTFDDFDAWAGDYRAIHTKNVAVSGADSFYFAAMKVQQLQPYETQAPLHLLDVGCGDGSTEVFIQQYFPQWQSTGIDVSEASIRVAREKGLPRASFQHYDGSHIPLADASADIVFMAGVLHHVDRSLHATLLKEIARVLKPGGRFYLFEHNPNNPLTRYLVNTCVFDKDARLLQSGYASRLVKAVGLRMVKKQFIIFFPRKGFWNKLLFLEKYLGWLPLGGQYFIAAKK